MFLVQIGSGSANFDTHFEDGFTNFVNSKNTKSTIYIVEENSSHIKNLKKFWNKKKI